LATVFQAIDVSRVLYVLPAWFGQLTQLDIGRIGLNGLFRKAHRWQLARLYSGAVGRDGWRRPFQDHRQKLKSLLLSNVTPIQTKSVFITQTWTSFSSPHSQ